MSFLFLTFLVAFVYIIACIVFYFTTKTNPNQGLVWGWFGIGSAIYIVFAAFFVTYYAHRRDWLQACKDNYNSLVKRAQTDSNCLQTQRQQCLNESLALKRTNDVTRAPRIQALSNSGQTLELAQERASLARDQDRIAKCENLSASNACIENVISACSDVVAAKAQASRDPQLLQQFQDFRTKHSAPEVMAFCKTATI